MPFSARTRAAIRTFVVALAATIALLGLADTAAGATDGPLRGAAMTATTYCGNCGGGF